MLDSQTVQTSRRSVLKGAAWAVPAVTVVNAAPAIAASPTPPQPGLNGWVVIDRFSRNVGSFWSPDWRGFVRYDGYRNGDNWHQGERLGLWVWDATIAEITEAPYMLIDLPYAVTWSLEPGNNGWSIPQYVGRVDEAGLNWYRYRSNYNPAAGYTQAGNEVVLNGRPYFVGNTGQRSLPSQRRQRITRAVGINGSLLSFTREVSFPQNANLMNQPMVDSEPDGAATSIEDQGVPVEDQVEAPPVVA